MSSLKEETDISGLQKERKSDSLYFLSAANFTWVTVNNLAKTILRTVHCILFAKKKNQVHSTLTLSLKMFFALWLRVEPSPVVSLLQFSLALCGGLLFLRCSAISYWLPAKQRRADQHPERGVEVANRPIAASGQTFQNKCQRDNRILRFASWGVDHYLSGVLSCIHTLSRYRNLLPLKGSWGSF